ncbi:MAG: TlpA family protein disulfide reductase [Anaerolineae bacterium]
MHELEQTYGDKIEFVYLNIDDPSTAAMKQKLGYRYQPHTFLLDANGEIVEQWLGYNSPNVYEDAFERLLNS